jgi:hypothetical protein
VLSGTRVLAAALLLTGAGLGSVSAAAASADVVDPTPSPTASASPLTSAAPDATGLPAEVTPEGTSDSAPVSDPASSPQPVPPAAAPEPALATLSAAGSVGAASSTPPVGNLDGVRRTTAGIYQVYGWAVDADQPGGAVTVHYYVNGTWGGSVTTDVPRDDVDMQVPGAGPNQGFEGTFPAVDDGTYQVCAYAIDTSDADLNTPLGCRTFSIDSNLRPQGSFEGMTTSGSTITLQGWAFDPDVPTAQVAVHYYVDGAWGGSVLTAVGRPDVAAAFPGVGPNQGFRHTFVAAAGYHEVCAWAIDPQVSSAANFLDCRRTYVGFNAVPVGNFEHLTASGSSVTLQGWAFDPDAPAQAVTVHYYVDGAWGGSLTTTVARPDVAAVYRDAGSSQGFTGTFTLAGGAHEVCVYAIDNQVNRNTSLFCRTVTVA